MTIKISEFKSYDWTERGWIGANSVDTTGWIFFVTKTNEFVTKATAGSEISWASITQKLYDSDNETVAKDALNYIPTNVDNTYDVTISNGTITIVDEWKYFDLQSANVVNWATESTTTGQLRMVKFVSATNSTFEIANI